MKSSTSSTRSSVRKRPLLAAWPLLMLPVLVHAQTAGAEAAPKKQTTAPLAPVNQAWPGKRVALVLPLRTGEAWNANPEFTRMFLPQAQAALREALGRTGKFSTLEVRRFNPVLMRAVQDGAATTDDLNTLLNQPTVPNAGVFLTKISFNSAPLQSFATSATIGSFVLESIQQNDIGLRLKVTGRMYDPGATTAARALSATVTVPYNFASGSARTPGLIAANVGFDRVLQEFTRYPTERELPIVPAVSAATVVATAPESSTPAEVSTTTTTTTSSTVVLPGTPIAGASSRPLTSDGRAMAPSTTDTTTSSSTTTTTTSTVVPVSPSLVANATSMMPGWPAGITVEVETPPAEVFPAAAPVDNGGGGGTDPVDGAGEPPVDEAPVVDDTTVVEETPSTDDTAVVEGDTPTEGGDGTTPDGDAPTDATDGGSGDSGSGDGSGGDSSSGGNTGGDTGTSTPGSPGGDDAVDEITDIVPPEENNVTTSVSPRIRDRAPGELPSFER